MLTRRELLAASAALATAPGVQAFAATNPGTAISEPVLITVFLRGGMDALSVIAPIDDPDYMADRPPELRLAADGTKPALQLAGAPAGFDFRLHGEAQPLLDLYGAKRLAFVHAAGITNGTRSHFGAQELIERGLGNPEDATRVAGGWMARWLAAAGRKANPAFAATPSSPQALLFHPDTICAADLRGGLGLPGGAQTDKVLNRLYGGSPKTAGSGVEVASLQTLEGIKLIDGRLRQADGKIAPYGPANGAAYDDTEVGRALASVARVIRMDLGIRAYCVDMGGWDTHENQVGRIAALTGQLSRAIAAFNTDLQDRQGRTVLVVMSEFGRRLRSNKSNGTDHGHGGLMMVMAPRIDGGRIHGTWPGLGPEQLDNRVDLAVTTDIRSVLAELMQGPLATPRALAAVFPGFTPRPVGLIRAA